MEINTVEKLQIITIEEESKKSCLSLDFEDLISRLFCYILMVQSQVKSIT